MKKDYNQVVGRLEDGFALENQCFSYSKSTRFACMRTMANELWFLFLFFFLFSNNWRHVWELQLFVAVGRLVPSMMGLLCMGSHCWRLYHLRAAPFGWPLKCSHVHTIYELCWFLLFCFLVWVKRIWLILVPGWQIDWDCREWGRAYWVWYVRSICRLQSPSHWEIYINIQYINWSKHVNDVILSTYYFPLFSRDMIFIRLICKLGDVYTKTF